MSCTSRAWARILRRPDDQSAMKLWVQARPNVDMPELESDLRAGVDINKEVLLAKLIDREICQVRDLLAFSPVGRAQADASSTCRSATLKPTSSGTSTLTCASVFAPSAGPSCASSRSRRSSSPLVRACP